MAPLPERGCLRQHTEVFQGKSKLMDGGKIEGELSVQRRCSQVINGRIILPYARGKLDSNLIEECSLELAGFNLVFGPGYVLISRLLADNPSPEAFSWVGIFFEAWW